MVTNDTKTIFVRAINHSNVYAFISCLLMVFIRRLPNLLWLGFTKHLTFFREGYPGTKLKR